MKREDIKEMLDCIMTLGLADDEAVDYIESMISECSGWINVKERPPTAGEECLFYRPLAEKTGDRVISVKVATKDNNDCWKETVPAGCEPCNPSNGACHVTHWMPLPRPPEK